MEHEMIRIHRVAAGEHVYELAVDEAHRRQGVATMLVNALGELARERGCFGMRLATEPDNAAAIATYRATGVTEPEPTVVLAWTLDRG